MSTHQGKDTARYKQCVTYERNLICVVSDEMFNDISVAFELLVFACRLGSGICTGKHTQGQILSL